MHCIVAGKEVCVSMSLIVCVLCFSRLSSHRSGVLQAAIEVLYHQNILVGHLKMNLQNKYTVIARP